MQGFGTLKPMHLQRPFIVTGLLNTLVHEVFKMMNEQKIERVKLDMNKNEQFSVSKSPQK